MREKLDQLAEKFTKDVLAEVAVFCQELADLSGVFNGGPDGIPEKTAAPVKYKERRLPPKWRDPKMQSACARFGALLRKIPDGKVRETLRSIAKEKGVKAALAEANNPLDQNKPKSIDKKTEDRRALQRQYLGMTRHAPKKVSEITKRINRPHGMKKAVAYLSRYYKTKA